jgi:hypothetical protein
VHIQVSGERENSTRNDTPRRQIVAARRLNLGRHVQICLAAPTALINKLSCMKFPVDSISARLPARGALLMDCTPHQKFSSGEMKLQRPEIGTFLEGSKIISR